MVNLCVDFSISFNIGLWLLFFVKDVCKLDLKKKNRSNFLLFLFFRGFQNFVGKSRNFLKFPDFCDGKHKIKFLPQNTQHWSFEPGKANLFGIASSSLFLIHA